MASTLADSDFGVSGHGKVATDAVGCTEAITVEPCEGIAGDAGGSAARAGTAVLGVALGGIGIATDTPGTAVMGTGIGVEVAEATDASEAREAAEAAAETTEAPWMGTTAGVLRWTSLTFAEGERRCNWKVIKVKLLSILVLTRILLKSDSECLV